MDDDSTSAISQLHRLGYVVLTGVFAEPQMAALARRLSSALRSDKPSVLRSRGETYGSRDLISLLPEVCEIPRHPRLLDVITSVLGSEAGLVRALYFDKPPERSWSLPWHKDRTIAVKDHAQPSSHFSKPTMKAGIPHVEAPESLLERMLTLRVHLDPMTADNGPLSVIPGSHIVAHDAASPPVELHASSGDVLAMRPLLSHSSSLPTKGTALHRRVIHLEFAPSEDLPDGYAWHSFDAVGSATLSKPNRSI